MTDYWVPTKKHYCEVCKCWVSGHLQNITRHESSIRHISTLRNKMMESHRRKTRKKKQEKFEEEEIKRLNTITLDNPVPTENSTNVPLVNDLFLYRPLVQPTLDLEAEKKRIAKSINRSLAGYEEPEHVDLNYNTTRWIATIDQDDGSLVYYNSLTGVRTKARPKDFDGLIPTSASQLASNWVLKFDPFKGKRYYHNVDTGEVRWVEDNVVNDVTPVTRSNSGQNELQRPAKADNTSYIHFNMKCELKLPEQPAIQVKLSNSVKPESTDKSEKKEDDIYEPPNNELKNLTGPVIGQWEVVNPTESVFSHWVENEEIFLNPDQPHQLNEPVVGNNFEQEPLVDRNMEEEKRVVKPVYKRSTEDRQEEDQKNDERKPMVFNKRRVRKRS